MEHDHLLLGSSFPPDFKYNNMTESFTTDWSIVSLNSNSTFVQYSQNIKREYIDFTILLTISFLSLSSNLRVCSIVTCSRRKCHRTVSILIGHLTVITIASNLHEVLYFADKCEMVILRAPYFCGVISFVRNTLHAMFPLNVFAIIYERVRTLNATEKTLLVYRTILLIWVVAAVGSLPSLFCYRYEPDATGTGFGKCRKVLPVIWLIVYELSRLVFFHVFICGCIAWLLYTIRSKIKYLHFLQPIPTERTRQKVYKIRFVYIYAILFIVLWVAVGLLLFLIKILPTISGVMSSINILRMAITLTFLYYTYCILNPLIYICLNEDMSVRNLLGIDSAKHLCCRLLFQKDQGSNTMEMVTIGDEKTRNGSMEISDFSQIPTFGVTEQIARPADENSAKIDIVDVDVDVEPQVSESMETFV